MAKESKKAVRERFRNLCFTRERFKCAFCPNNQELDAHHITDRKAMPNGGYVKENGITLCPECHWKAEQFHISGGLRWEHGFHPDDLYRKIRSSYLTAYQESLKL